MPAKLFLIVKWEMGFAGINFHLDSLVPFRILHFSALLSLTSSTSRSLVQGLLGDAPYFAICRLLMLVSFDHKSSKVSNHMSKLF